MTQNVPIKCDTSLNVSGLTTERKLIVKCCKMKIMRKNAESAMANFLPIEEFKIPLIIIVVNYLYNKDKEQAVDLQIYNLILII